MVKPPIADPRITEVAVVDASDNAVLATGFAHEGHIELQVDGHDLRRLKLIAFDLVGRSSCYSADFGIVTNVQEDVVFAGSDLSITVAPHPVSEQSTLTLNGSVEGPVRIRLVDTQGRTHLDTWVQLEQGSHTLSLSGGGLPSGVYTIAVTGSGILVSHPLVVVH